MAKEPARKKPSQAIAIVALLVNLLILPGLGSIIGGRTKEGIIQLALLIGGTVIFIIGVPLLIVLVGMPLIALGALLAFAAWVWGIVTGIQLIRESE